MRVLDADQLGRVVGEYDRDGYAYVRSMFSTDDIAPLVGALADGAAPGAFSVNDSRGGRQELSAWLHLGDDLIGWCRACARSSIWQPPQHVHDRNRDRPDQRGQRVPATGAWLAPAGNDRSGHGRSVTRVRRTARARTNPRRPERC